MKLLGDAIAAEIHSALSAVGTPAASRLRGLGGLETLANAPLPTQTFPTESSPPLWSYWKHTGLLRKPCGGMRRVPLLMVPIGEDSIKNSLK